MTALELMRSRHSVRQYKAIPVENEKIAALQAEIAKINAESGLTVRLFTEEPKAFGSGLVHYGSFSGCKNYFTISGAPGRDEAVGYYGERLVLFAQSLGLNTCWVALTYKKSAVQRRPEDGKHYIVISLGYGENEGHAHKSKSADRLSDLKDGDPEWYARGIEAAMLAPTAVNQQRFYISRSGSRVKAKRGFGTLTEMDLGIVKYHFELGAGTENFEWEK